jgi:hypothetical protein
VAYALEKVNNAASPSLYLVDSLRGRDAHRGRDGNLDRTRAFAAPEEQLWEDPPGGTGTFAVLLRLGLEINRCIHQLGQSTVQIRSTGGLESIGESGAGEGLPS